MGGVGGFSFQNKGNFSGPFLFYKTTPTITLSAVIRFRFGLTGVKPATPHETRIPARASRVFTAHNASSKLRCFFMSICSEVLGILKLKT